MTEVKSPFPMSGLDPMKMKVLGVNVFPAMIKFISMLPDKARREMSTKQHAPTPEAVPYDQYDCLGTDPYHKVEVKEGKVWRVTYAMENKNMTSTKQKKEAKGLGMDFTDEDVQKKIRAGAATEGEKAMELVEADLAKIVALWKKTEWTMKERFSVPPHNLNSMVVKLNSGSVLLYAPVRVRDEVGFGEWLDAIGKVEWVVVASSFHTLCLPAILARYPQAKVIAATQAQDKLNKANALVRGKVDFSSSVDEELDKANKELQAEGVQLFSVKGDVCTNVLMAVAHGVLLTCDLVYCRHDGGILNISREEFNEFKEEHADMRLFKYLNCNKPNSPNGFLAKYRFLFMDDTGMGRMMYEPPARDGSSCAAMAASLRAAMLLEFDAAVGVHFDHMAREDFRKTIDANWNWLDGRSLI